jgi:hypothetical protein
MVSYDNVPQILELYPERAHAIYNLDYSAATRTKGTEVMFFCDDLRIPGQTPPGMKVIVSKKSVTREWKRTLRGAEQAKGGRMHALKVSQRPL